MEIDTQILGLNALRVTHSTFSGILYKPCLGNALLRNDTGPGCLSSEETLLRPVQSLRGITARQTQASGHRPFFCTIMYLPLFSLHTLESENQAEINSREVSTVSLASSEPCANELILHTYIYIKSALIIHIGQNSFVSKKKEKSYMHSTKTF